MGEYPNPDKIGSPALVRGGGRVRAIPDRGQVSTPAGRVLGWVSKTREDGGPEPGFRSVKFAKDTKGRVGTFFVYPLLH